MDCTHPHEAYLKKVGNPKNWDQLEKVFALDHIPSEELQFETVKQRPLSPESLKIK